MISLAEITETDLILMISWGTDKIKSIGFDASERDGTLTLHKRLLEFFFTPPVDERNV